MENFITPNAKSKVGVKDRDNELSTPLPVIGMTYENHLNSINKDTDNESKKPIIDSLVEGEFPSVPVKIGFDTYTLISIASITLMIVAIILIFKKYKK